LSDPFELPDMDAAVERILAAITNRERIVIYGDYDVDGVTSSALLQRVLQAAGATVANFLPQRGGGRVRVSRGRIARCLKEHKPQLLIAVDCAPVPRGRLRNFQKHGVDTIGARSPRQPPGGNLPKCVALVNPKRNTAVSVGCTGQALALLSSSLTRS